MIYDCFSFFNELDVLEIRLNALNDVVDRFVLVEAPWTHTGKPKPLHFAENKQRFAPFLDKIIHIVVSDADLPTIPTGASDRDIAWIRENVQRNAIVKGLSAAKPDDVILISDLDEIPDPEIVKTEAARPIGITNLNLRNYAFFLNNRNISFPNWTGGPQLLSYETFRDPDTYRNFQHSEYAPECANTPPSATIIRFTKKTKAVKNAGWHFSYMGGLSAIQNKLRSFSHTECADIADDPKALQARIANGKGLPGLSDFFMPEPLELQMPQHIARSAEKMQALILPCDLAAWRKRAVVRILARAKHILHDLVVAFIIETTPKSLVPLAKKIRTRLSVRSTV